MYESNTGAFSQRRRERWLDVVVGWELEGGHRKKKTQYSYEVKSPPLPPFFFLKATNEILGATVELYSLCLSHSAAYETS